MNKYTIIGGIGLVATLGYAMANLNTWDQQFCQQKDWENMTVAKIMTIQEECEKELEFLGQEYDLADKEHAEKQQKRKANADSVRSILDSMPIKEAIQENNGVVEVAPKQTPKQVSKLPTTTKLGLQIK